MRAQARCGGFADQFDTRPCSARQARECLHRPKGFAVDDQSLNLPARQRIDGRLSPQDPAPRASAIKDGAHQFGVPPVLRGQGYGQCPVLNLVQRGIGPQRNNAGHLRSNRAGEQVADRVRRLLRSSDDQPVDCSIAQELGGGPCDTGPEFPEMMLDPDEIISPSGTRPEP